MLLSRSAPVRDAAHAARPPISHRTHEQTALVLQVGANVRSELAIFGHDPVPRLIARGWAAILMEPQPALADALRLHYSEYSRVTIVPEAFCADGSTASAALWYINATATLGSNESDARCIGNAI